MITSDIIKDAQSFLMNTYSRQPLVLVKGRAATVKVLLEDAKAATQAALEEGIVPGGGVALILSEKALDKVEGVGDEAMGVKIIRSVLDYPLRCIAENWSGVYTRMSTPPISVGRREETSRSRSRKGVEVVLDYH